MEIKFKVDDADTLAKLNGLTPRQFMIGWTTKVKQLAEARAREKIGGDFGHDIANGSIQTDESNPNRHVIYTGGKNGYIAEHVHFGGPIRSSNRKYLAIPTKFNKNKDDFASTYGENYFVLIRNNKKKRAYLYHPEGGKLGKPMFTVVSATKPQKPRPWWPEDWEVREVTEQFIREKF